MTNKPLLDEYLEQLWYMKEEGKTSIDALKEAMRGLFDSAALDELLSGGLAEMTQESAIALTNEGETEARQLIRAHRLAERMLHDVLGGDFEKGACEVEHTVSAELIDGICTLLGHPRECPHGMPIPEGECCRRSASAALSCIVSLTRLKLGQSARIAYINCRSDKEIHKLEGLCIRPEATIKLHQNYPTYVIECEGASIALDKDIAANICVWREAKSDSESAAPGTEAGEKKTGIFEKVRQLFKKKDKKR
ncbi:MAG: metal-dependent transcriptional regulator [Candidatus Omnitrophica bacterium]|nr:metal-dependent transcriptional regulator [Candidatus Omnitrophota bacterium]